MLCWFDFLLFFFAACSTAIPTYSSKILNNLQPDQVDSHTITIPLKRVERTEEQRKTQFQGIREHHVNLLAMDEKIDEQMNLDLENPAAITIKFSTYSLWIGQLSIGTPMQDFDVVFDTGSSQLWINNDACPDAGCVKNSQFVSSESTTYKETKLDMDVTFGTGQISGRIIQETVTIGGVAVSDMFMGVINSETGQVFVDYAIDGILGLSFKDLSSLPAQGVSYVPLMEAIRDQDLSDPKISFYYNGDHSQVIMGPVEKHVHYTGKLQYIDVSREYYWEVEMVDIKIGGELQNMCSSQSCRCVVDTGTSFLTGPSSNMRTVLDLVTQHVDEGQSACHHLDQLPDLTYVLQDSKGTYEYTLHPEEYMANDGSECEPAMMGLDVASNTGDVWILGDIFIEKYFTVFSRDDGNGVAQIGLATRA